MWNTRVKTKFLGVLLPVAAMAAPLATEIIYINQFAVNVPVGDEWALAQDVRAVALGTEDLRDLWRQHNEHRIFFPRLALLITAGLSGWNVIAEMYLSVLLAFITLVAWWLLYRRVHPAGLWAFVPIPWLVHSLGQWENILTGWQLQFYLGVAASVWCLCLLPGRTWPALIRAAGCGVLASYSFNNGLLIWPVGLAVLAAIRAEKTQIAFWSAAGVLVTAGYYYGYQAPENHPSPLQAFQHPFETLAFFVANVGTPLAAGSLALGYITGTYVLALLLIHVHHVLRRRLSHLSDVEAALCGLVLVSLLSSLAIAVGRVGFHQPAWATSSRYVTITTVGTAATYLLLLGGATHRAAAAAGPATNLLSQFFTLIVIGVSLAVPWSVDAGHETNRRRLNMKYVTQTSALQTDEAFESLTVARIVRQHAPFMQSRRLSVFGDPPMVLSLGTTEGGLPVGEIVAGRPVVQQLTCPVETLQDMQVLFATYERTNAVRIDVELSDGSRTIFSRSIAAAALEDNKWFTFDISPPLEHCAGRQLVLTVRSPDGSPGNAITIWTYPRYYYGTLVAPTDPEYAGRSLGVMMNAARFNLMK